MRFLFVFLIVLQGNRFFIVEIKKYTNSSYLKSQIGKRVHLILLISETNQNIMSEYIFFLQF